MEFRHYELGRQLVARGWTVAIVSGSYSHLYSRPPEVHATYAVRVVDGMTYCWVRVPVYERSASFARVLNMAVFMLRLYRLPVRSLPIPDVVVVSSPSLFPILPAKRLARRLRARLVFELRDIWPLTLQELAGMSDVHPLVVALRWFERYAYRTSDRVVSVLPAASSYLHANGVPAERIDLIPNGVAPEIIHSEPDPTPDVVAYAVRRHAFTVGFVGTLGTANAIDSLVEAARLLVNEDIGVVIAGHGPEAGRLRDLASDLPHVAFVGPVAKADVPAVLAALDACYVGYHRSVLYEFGISPNKVFDYMAAGRPVILAASAANDPVADAGCGLTVEPDDPAGLAAAILAIRGLTLAERDRLGASGRRYVERVHGYDRLAEAYEHVLDRTR
jgi:glycosyltransferase involved in cell wall biosynthesis